MRGFSWNAHDPLTPPPHSGRRVAGTRRDEHEHPLTRQTARGRDGPRTSERGPARGAPRERGAVRPQLAALVAAGFLGAAAAVGAMTLLLSPNHPPPLKPIEVGQPAAPERSDERRERLEERRRSERRERLERRRRQARRRAARRDGGERHAPVSPGAGPAPSAPAPAPAQPAPSQPAPAPAPRPAPAPAPAPSPPAPTPTPDDDRDDDDGGDDDRGDDGGDDDGGDD
jgi:hypothetical protein